MIKTYEMDDMRTFEVNSEKINKLAKFFQKEKLNYANIEKTGSIELLDISFCEPDIVTMNFSFNGRKICIKTDFDDFADSFSSLEENNECLNDVKGFRKFIKKAVRIAAYEEFVQSYGNNILCDFSLNGFNFTDCSIKGTDDIHLNITGPAGVLFSNLPIDYAHHVSCYSGKISIEADLSDKRWWVFSYREEGIQKFALIGKIDMLSIDDFSNEDIGICQTPDYSELCKIKSAEEFYSKEVNTETITEKEKESCTIKPTNINDAWDF